jgi:HK97 family phage prohead protease
MSEVVEEATVDNIKIRTFAVAQHELDGRTLHVRIVPFGQIADVADPPDFRPYKEEFLPGVFSRQMNAANRVRLRTDHAAIDRNGDRKSGLNGVVGNGTALRENAGGVEGEFLFLENNEAEVARELVRTGGYDGVSAEFMPRPGGSVRTSDGVVQRKSAHLDSVALAIGPAYSQAEILALREGEDMIIDEDMLPPKPNLEILERCLELGIPLPDGMAILLERGYTEIPWDGSASRFDTPEAYCAAAAIDLNPSGGPKTKDRCHLPYKEPSGEINVGGVRAALSEIGKGNPLAASAEQRDAAEIKLKKILDTFSSTSSST